MFTDKALGYVERASQLVLKHTFPRNSEVAAMSGAVLWLARRACKVEATIALQNINVQMSKGIFGDNFFGWGAGKFSSWFWVSDAAEFAAIQYSIGCALAASFTLNMIALAIFGPKKGGNGKHTLPQVLERIGIDVKPKDESASTQPVSEQPKTMPVLAAEKADQQSAKDTAINADLARLPARTESQRSSPGHQNSRVAARRTADSEHDELDKSADESSSENTENVFDDDPLTMDRGLCSFCC